MAQAVFEEVDYGRRVQTIEVRSAIRGIECTITSMEFAASGWGIDAIGYFPTQFPQPFHRDFLDTGLGEIGHYAASNTNRARQRRNIS